MAKKITYLLGAGASANSLPVVKNMNGRIFEIISILESEKKDQYNEEAQKQLPSELMDERNQKILVQIIADLKWLLKEAGNYYTIDTLAKKFYLTGKWNNELTTLKRALILYFTIEQFVLKSDDLDKRYASFLAAILERKDNNLSINSNIKILSWNYDMQFELTLNKFLEIPIDVIKDRYNIFPKTNSTIEDTEKLINSKEFGLIKINGNAIWGIYEGEKNIFDLADDYPHDDIHHRLGSFLEHYRLSNSRNNSKHPNFYSRYLNFAWENEKTFTNKHERHLKNLMEAVYISQNTEILVVIGYSFPVFNREIDSYIFSHMRKLKKVYIQDDDPERIKSTMLNAFEVLQITENKTNDKGEDILKVKFLLEKNTDQFVIPYELNQE